MITRVWFPVIALLLAAATGQESTTRDEIRPQVSAAKQRLVDSIRLSRQLQSVRQNLPGRITATAERNQKKRQLADLRMNFPQPLSPKDQSLLPFFGTTLGTGLGANIVSQIPSQPRQIITARITETSSPNGHVTITTPSELQRRINDFDRSHSFYHKHGHHHDHHATHRHGHKHHHDHHEEHKHNENHKHHHGHHHHSKHEHHEEHKHDHHKHQHDRHEHRYHHEEHKHHEGHDHKHSHKHKEDHEHDEDHHHEYHEDHNHHHTLDRHDHGHSKNFVHESFESSPAHEEYAFAEESAAISVTPSVRNGLKIMQPAKIRESAEHVEV